MSGAGIRVEVDDRTLQASLRRLTARLDDPGQVMDEIGSMLVASTLNRFEHQRSPDGKPWRKSARARRTSGQTLSDSGRLRNSITHRVLADALEVGTNIVYAAIHQFGGKTPPRTIRPKRKKALFWPGAAHPVKAVDHPGSTIPARPFLGMSAADRTSTLKIMKESLARAVA